jgi:RNA polymerase sigma factor (sigma-70 family)
MKLRRPEVLSDVYRCYSERTRVSIFRIVRNWATAEDLLQETFLLLWESAERFDPDKGTLSAWLSTIARNRSLDYLRSGCERRNSRSCELREDHRCPGDSESHFVARAEQARVRKVVATLNANHQSVIQLRYFEGFSDAEIAVRLGKPLGTIKTWSRGALQKLREQIRLPVAQDCTRETLARGA